MTSATSATIDPRAAEVLDFWFGKPGDTLHLQTRPEWFRKDEIFDALIAQRFGALIDAGLRGLLASWVGQPLPALALIVVLDQFTRSMRRGTAGMFDGDTLALSAARAMVQRGDDLQHAGMLCADIRVNPDEGEAADVRRERSRSFQHRAVRRSARPHRGNRAHSR